MEFDHFAENYQQILDHSVAVSGEDSSYFSEYKARYLRRVLSDAFSGKVLDFGCGVGLLSRFLTKYLTGARVDGFDISADSVSRADATLTRQGTFTSDPSRLGGDYDLIVVSNVMHHIPPNQRQATVCALTARLQATGKLAVFEHNPANPLTRWVVERCPFDDDAILLKPIETAGYLRQANLTIWRQDYIVFMPRFLAWLRPIEPALARLPLGAQYVTVAEKRA